jgi:ATP-dependent DNA helicase RecQ
MKYLCDFLGERQTHSHSNCDNTGLPKFTLNSSKKWIDKVQSFWENYFPILEVESNNSNIINGVAASYYGTSNVGAALHRSKYETQEDFPEFLIQMTLKAFRKKLGQEKFDYIAHVPPTKSADLVKNFAVKISQALNIPITHDLVKIRQTQQQKLFENSYSKTDNIKGAFSFKNPDMLKGKAILLIDDIFDSGATLKEIGKLFTTFGATKIAPMVIAKTVSSDII